MLLSLYVWLGAGSGPSLRLHPGCGSRSCATPTCPNNKGLWHRVWGGGRSKGTQAVFRWWSGSQQPACACALSSPPPPQLTSGPRRVIPWALPLSFASAASLCPWHEGQWLEPLLGLFQYVPELSLWNMNWSPSWPLGDVSIPLSDPGMWSTWPWDKTTERCQACELEPPPPLPSFHHGAVVLCPGKHMP